MLISCCTFGRIHEALMGGQNGDMAFQNVWHEYGRPALSQKRLMTGYYKAEWTYLWFLPKTMVSRDSNHGILGYPHSWKSFVKSISITHMHSCAFTVHEVCCCSVLRILSWPFVASLWTTVCCAVIKACSQFVSLNPLHLMSVTIFFFVWLYVAVMLGDNHSVRLHI